MIDSIRFGGYKSFLSEDNKISKMGYLNLFIGRNNSGKSSVLDIIGAAYSPDEFEKIYKYSSRNLKIQRGYEITEHFLMRAFGNGTSKYVILNSLRNEIGKTFWLKTEPPMANGNIPKAYPASFNRDINPELHYGTFDWEKYARIIPDASKRYTFKKITAERNIVPEKTEKVALNPDGSGATGLIRLYLTSSTYDEQIIEGQLLSALNSIMGTDAEFESIRVQQNGTESDSEWEVYLQENGSKRFPLSQSGSGLKTIILVLLNLIVIPQMRPDDAYVFGFEELENNLHPALQRRLYEYIYKYAVDKHIPIFLTTHSHVAINMFFDKSDVAIYHITKSGQSSKIKRIENYIDRVEILDDLDVKASDLLQANGVIWVEGPSDRIYIKRWLEVFCDNDICEGNDYQFAYYGGRLLSHYTAEEKTDDLINILLINRNSAIIMDSDKRSRNSQINATKKRIHSEFESKGLFSWITKGKEIENYLSINAINSVLENKVSAQCEQYELFPEYIDGHYTNFSGRKVQFASIVKEHIAKENILDLERQITKLHETIKRWNS